MTRVIMPLLSQDARGSVSGIQFSRNPYGSIGSRKATSKHSQSERVTAFRAHLSRAQHLWDAASDADRATWDRWATPGRTARSWFIAGYLRQIITSVKVAVADGAGNPHTSLFNLVFEDHGGSPPQLVLAYDFTGAFSNTIRGSVHASWGPRSSVHRRKYLYNTQTPVFGNAIVVTPEVIAPNYQVLYELIDWKNGRLLASWRYDWPIP